MENSLSKPTLLKQAKVTEDVHFIIVLNFLLISNEILINSWLSVEIHLIGNKEKKTIWHVRIAKS